MIMPHSGQCDMIMSHCPESGVSPCQRGKSKGLSGRGLCQDDARLLCIVVIKEKQKEKINNRTCHRLLPHDFERCSDRISALVRFFGEGLRHHFAEGVAGCHPRKQ